MQDQPPSVGAEVSTLPPLPNPGAAPSLGRLKRCLLPWLASADSEELLTWSEITSGGAADGSEPAAQSLLVSARYPPQGRGYPQPLLPPCLPFSGLL